MNAEEIIVGINEGKILPASILQIMDVDAYLDRRDSNEVFEMSLLSAFEEVSDISNQQISGYKKLHLKIFNHIDSIIGTSDLSCYVAEDFEVMLKMIFKGSTNSFLEGMLEQYLNGQLPCV